MPSDSPALTSVPNRYWPDDRSQCSRYEGTAARSSLMMSVATPATADRRAAPSGATVASQSATAAAAPGGASTSHSPGPDPTTSQTPSGPSGVTASRSA